MTTISRQESLGTIAKGMCPVCGVLHCLEQGPARKSAYDLMERLETYGRIDFLSDNFKADPLCSTSPLFTDSRGKMFGVLTGTDREGKRVVAHAFSGQFNGRWSVPGWVRPVFEVEAFHDITLRAEKEIKQLGRRMEAFGAGTRGHGVLKRRRREKSRRLMRRIHRLYTLRNFRGQSRPLVDLFPGPGEPPTGTCDCCAPKLLSHAVLHGIRPDGIAEFFWGRENKSMSRIHGSFYPPCSTRCEPILGFLLCGVRQ